MPQAFRNNYPLTLPDDEITFFSLKIDLAFKHDKRFIFVLMSMPSFKFTLKPDQSNNKIVYICQVNR